MTLLELFQLLKKHLQLVITLPVVCAIAMGIVSFVAMDNTYTATTSMYILAKTDDSGQMSYNDLSASQMLSNDIATLLDSDSVKSGAANELGLTDLDDYKVSVSSETTTRVITLSVTGTDAKETAKVAKAMASSVSTVAQNVGAAQSINVIDEAKTPRSPQRSQAYAVRCCRVPRRYLYRSRLCRFGRHAQYPHPRCRRGRRAPGHSRCWPNSGYERW